MQITKLQTLKYTSLSDNITYGHSYAQSPNVKKNKKNKKTNAKEYGRNMLLSWKTHYFEPLAHF